ncbi:MAG: septum site-determining protein MinC [Firmicutes bacterium]|nr:septum site-determining protein MinC [Bacillota bacterium]
MKTEDVIFKGTGHGIWIILPHDEDFVRLKGKLADKLESTDGFFAGATRGILDIGELALQEEDVRELVGIIESFGISVSRVAGGVGNGITAVAGGEGRQRRPVEARGGSGSRRKSVVREHRRSTIPTDQAMLVGRTLRSGQRVTHSGNIVLLGDVNPGAEVVAGGNIIIVGSLRGVAHAGTPDNRRAVVVALRFMPTQLRIADLIARSPDGEHKAPRSPEVARIRNERIVIEAYSGWKPELEEEPT